MGHFPLRKMISTFISQHYPYLDILVGCPGKWILLGLVAVHDKPQRNALGNSNN